VGVDENSSEVYTKYIHHKIGSSTEIAAKVEKVVEAENVSV